MGYVRTARSKGLSPRVVTFRHTVRNALVPILTITGIQLATILGGVIVVEVVFAWPGLGRLVYNSVAARDYPVIQGAVLLIAVLFLRHQPDRGPAVRGRRPEDPAVMTDHDRRPRYRPGQLVAAAAAQSRHRRQRRRPGRRARRSRSPRIGLRRTASTTSTCRARCSRPSGAHWFGTDELGRDVLSRVLVAVQASMQVAVVSVAFAVVVGVTIGVVAGYRGGWVDTVFMRVVDVMFAFPVLLLALGDRGDPRPRRHDHDAGDRHRLHADLRPGRAGQHPGRAGRAVRRGVAHDGHRARLHPDPPRPAEHRRAADRADVAVAGVRDPVRGGAVVPRPRHPAAASRRWAG